MACAAAGLVAKPVYDRAILHVLSRRVRRAAGHAHGLASAKAGCERARSGAGDRVVWFDLTRSFRLLCAAEGQSAAARAAARCVAAHARRRLTVAVCIEIFVIYNSIGASRRPSPQPPRGKPQRSLGAAKACRRFLATCSPMRRQYGSSSRYVAAGFALYLTRRTLLEGWDIEMALRRIAERHAVAVVILSFTAVAVVLPSPGHAQEKNPKQEIAEVLKAKEFGYYHEVERWQSKRKDEEASKRGEERRGWPALGYALAKGAEVLLWIAAGALIAYALWWSSGPLPLTGTAAIIIMSYFVRHLPYAVRSSAAVSTFGTISRFTSSSTVSTSNTPARPR
jgi:hypothetical protein